MVTVGSEEKLRGFKSFCKNCMRKLCRLFFDVQMNMNTRISDSVSLSVQDKNELKLIAVNDLNFGPQTRLLVAYRI